MPQEPTRTARLEARLSPETLAIVKRAAELQGCSVSDFVVTAVQEAAQKTIEETSLIRLSIEDQRRFIDLLLNSPEPSPALQRAARHHHELFSRE